MAQFKKGFVRKTIQQLFIDLKQCLYFLLISLGSEGDWPWLDQPCFSRLAQMEPVCLSALIRCRKSRNCLMAADVHPVDNSDAEPLSAKANALLC